MVSKVRNVRLGVFSGGGCHHPNIIQSWMVNLILSYLSAMIEIDDNVSLYMFASGRHTPELGVLVMWLFFVLFTGKSHVKHKENCRLFL